MPGCWLRFPNLTIVVAARFPALIYAFIRPALTGLLGARPAVRERNGHLPGADTGWGVDVVSGHTVGVRCGAHAGKVDRRNEGLHGQAAWKSHGTRAQKGPRGLGFQIPFQRGPPITLVVLWVQGWEGCLGKA